MRWARHPCDAILNSLRAGGKDPKKIAPYKGQSIYLWGAGTHTSTIFQPGLTDGVRVAAIIDSNVKYQGWAIYGISVIAPEELQTRPVLPIVISSRIA